MKRFTASLILCLVLLSSCGEKAIEYGSFIDTRGTYELGEGASLEIFKDSNGLLNIRHTRSNGNISESVEGTVEEGSSWFIHVADSAVMWVATESDLVLMYEGENESGSISIFSTSEPNTINQTVYMKIPEAVMLRADPKLKGRIQAAQQGADGQSATAVSSKSP